VNSGSTVTKDTGFMGERFGDDVVDKVAPTVELEGTAQSGTATTIVLQDGNEHSISDDFYNDYYIVINSGTGSGPQGVKITDYVGATLTASVASWPIATPDATSIYSLHTGIVGQAAAGTTSTITLEATNGHSTSDDFYNGWWIKLTAGPGLGVTGYKVLDYVGATRVITIDGTFSGTPTTATYYALYSAAFVGVVFDESSNEMQFISAPVDVDGELVQKSVINGRVKNFVIEGDLTVQGLTTTVDTTNLTIEDNIIILNNNEAGAGVAGGTGESGIEIERGSLTNYSLVFDENNDNFTVGLVGGTRYVLSEIANADVQTDGSAVVWDSAGRLKTSTLTAADITTLENLAGGGIQYTATSVTSASTTLTASQTLILCDTTSNAVELKLPAAKDNIGRIYNVIFVNKGSTNNVTVTLDDAVNDYIDGEILTSVSMSVEHQRFSFVCAGDLGLNTNGGIWYIR
jgi:hypothetical protein